MRRVRLILYILALAGLGLLFPYSYHTSHTVTCNAGNWSAGVEIEWGCIVMEGGRFGMGEWRIYHYSYEAYPKRWGMGQIDFHGNANAKLPYWGYHLNLPLWALAIPPALLIGRRVWRWRRKRFQGQQGFPVEIVKGK